MQAGERRGNALLVALIAISVLMVLVVGALQFTGKNREAAALKTRGDQTSACAETARAYLLSRLRLFNVNVTGLTLDQVLVANADGGAVNDTKMLTAHYDQTSPDPIKPTVVPVSAAAVGASRKQIRDLANTVPGGVTLGGQYYRVVVKCREPGGRESELEFVFRYGL